MPKKFQLSFVFLRPILCVGLFFYSFFFFQAEDGIRYRNVTGVQTCALPISRAGCAPAGAPDGPAGAPPSRRSAPAASRAPSPRAPPPLRPPRSEERRVG